MKVTLRYSCLIPILIVLVSTIMSEDATAQLAKIHRKTATLELSPSMVTHGRTVAVSVQVWEERDGWRLTLVSSKGETVLRQPLEGDGPIRTQIVEIPERFRGEIRVVLEAQTSDRWSPVTEQRLTLIPDYYKKLLACRDAIESVEKNSSSNARLLRACWAALAHIEDVLERAKVDGRSWDLMRRLQQSEEHAKALAEGQDPFEKRTGYGLRGYRSELNGEIQLYSTYVPEDYDAGRPWPLAIMLHGAWSNHHLGLRRVLGHSNNRGEDDPAAKRSMPDLPDAPYLVVAPNGLETMGYEGFAEDDVWRVIDEIASLYNVDENRVYLTGLSMGGAGTGKLGIRHADRFAAIAPVCGFFGDVWADPDQKTMEYQQRQEELSAVHNVAENLLHVPVMLMHGDADPVVPPKASRELHARLQELGYNTSLEMYPGVQHDAWVPAYENTRVFEWFGQFERDPYPKKVVYKTGNSYGGSLYWVSIDEVETIRRFARVEAEVRDGTIEVKCENVRRLTLRPPKAILPSGSVVRMTIDEQSEFEWRGTNDSMSWVHQNGKWNLTKDELTKTLLPTRRGVHEARAARHVYVYGTAGSAEETEEARTLAITKSLPGGNADVHWDVLPEDELTGEIIHENNIVLFTTLAGSAFLNEHLNALPIKKTKSAITLAGRRVEKDQAVSFIVPNPANPNKYLQVNLAINPEGLPALRPFTREQKLIQGETAGDFIAYDHTGSVIWGGLFDKNWEVEVVEGGE